MSDYVYTKIVARLMLNDILLGTAFFVGNNYFVSAGHCVNQEDPNASFSISFAEDEIVIPVSLVCKCEYNDIAILHSSTNIKIDSLQFIDVDELVAGENFQICGFGDRENYPTSIPTHDIGRIISPINHNKDLEIQASNLFVGMSGAPLIVSRNNKKYIAGMLKIVSKDGFYFKGANKNLAVSSNEIVSFLEQHSIFYRIISSTPISRKRIASKLYNLIKNKRNVKIALYGPKGMGKLETVRTVISDYATPIIYLQNNDGSSVLSLDRILLDPTIKELFAEISTLPSYRYLQNKELWLVIDGYSNFETDLLLFFDKVNAAVIVITECIPNLGTKWDYIEVPPLSKTEVANYILDECDYPFKITSNADAPFDALVSSLYQVCGGIPLLIRWACIQIFTYHKKMDQVIMALRHDDLCELEYHKHINKIFSSLNEEEFALIMFFSTSASGITSNLAQKILSLSDSAFYHALETLVKVCLIYSCHHNNNNVYYYVHPIVRNYCRNHDAFRYYVKKYIDVMSDFAEKNDFDAINIFDIEDTFLWCEQYDNNLYIQYMYAFSYYFFETGNIDLRENVGKRGLSLCEKYSWKRDYCWILINEVGYLEYIKGNYNIAEKTYESCFLKLENLLHDEQSLNTTQRGDRFSSQFIFGLLKRYLALVYSQTRLFEKALLYFQDSISIFKQLGRKSIINNVNLEMAELYLKMGNLDLAEQILLACEQHYRKMYKPWMTAWLARTNYNLCLLYRKKGDRKKSLTHLSEAETIALSRCSNHILLKLLQVKAQYAFEEMDYLSARVLLYRASQIAVKMNLLRERVSCENTLSSYRLESYNMEKPSHELLVIVVTKAPYSNECKTRLARDVGELSTKIAESLLYDLINELSYSANFDFSLWIPDTDAKYKIDLENLLGPVDINIRSCHALRGATSDLYIIFNKMLEIYNKVLMVYSDTPFISRKIINEGFSKLELTDVVIGTDGAKGYYLLGMKKAIDVFTVLPNKTIPYLDETIDIINKNNMTVSFVQSLPDIDNLSDILKIDWFINDSWLKTRKCLINAGIIDPICSSVNGEEGYEP